MNIEVTTASKTGQKLSETANAIFVITQEDIRNSGANNVLDLLRMVPGLDVAQINASNWAISSMRGDRSLPTTRKVSRAISNGRWAYRRRRPLPGLNPACMPIHGPSRRRSSRPTRSCPA